MPVPLLAPRIYHFEATRVEVPDITGRKLGSARARNTRNLRIELRDRTTGCSPRCADLGKFVSGGTVEGEDLSRHVKIEDFHRCIPESIAPLPRRQHPDAISDRTFVSRTIICRGLLAHAWSEGAQFPVLHHRRVQCAPGSLRRVPPCVQAQAKAPYAECRAPPPLSSDHVARLEYGALLSISRRYPEWSCVPYSLHTSLIAYQSMMATEDGQGEIYVN
jgi:hypothetical protein